jgi:predicted RNase H-like HicB family nuclease
MRYKVVRLNYLGTVTSPARNEIDGTTSVRFQLLPQIYCFFVKCFVNLRIMEDIRINYVIDEGVYVGYIVNFESIICQADNIEELEKRLKAMLKAWLVHWDEIINKPDFSVNLVEQSGEDWMKKYN